MTREVYLTATSPTEGCTGTGCGTRYTVQLSPYHGRLCPRHAILPTIPPGPYRRELAMEMVDLGRPDCAFSYLRTWTARDIDARFRRAAQAVTG